LQRIGQQHRTKSKERMTVSSFPFLPLFDFATKPAWASGRVARQESNNLRQISQAT